MNSKKRKIVFAIVAVMMCVAVYLNWSYGGSSNELLIADGLNTAKTLGEAQFVDGKKPIEDSEDVDTAATENDYFSEARLTREQARASALTMLKSTVESSESSKEAKDKASDTISMIAENAVSESKIENLVKAKGYKDCVAIIDDDGISVIVAAGEEDMTAADAAKIKDIASSETKLRGDKIKIIETDK